jgi:hypothetical protein
LSYVQFAREGLGLQKTQIGGGVRLARAGAFDVRYHRYGSRVVGADGKPLPDDGDETGVESGFYDGIDTSIAGIASLAPSASAAVQRLLRQNLATLDKDTAIAQKDFTPENAAMAAPALADALKSVDGFIAQVEALKPDTLAPNEQYSLLHELRVKRVQLNNALVLALGITVAAETPTSNVIEGSDVEERITLRKMSAEPVTYKSAVSKGTLGVGETLQFHASQDSASSANPLIETAKIGAQITWEVTYPYFFRKSSEDPVYQLNAVMFRNSPKAVTALSCYISLEYKGVPLTVGAVAGHDGQPVQIVPPFSVDISPRLQLLPTGVDHFPARVSITPPNGASLRFTKGKLEVDSQTSDPSTGVTVFNIRVPSDRSAAEIEASAAYTPEGYSEGYRAVGYGDLPRTNFYTPATMRVVPVDVTTAPGLKIAYLPGTGDDVPSALADLGVPPHMVTVADLTAENLKPYDVVVLGVRPYEAHPELAAANPALLAYAQAGGIVILQYVARDLPAGSAPYPLSLGSNEKVVDETAPVNILTPDDPLLAWPNKISSADFSGWFEERGHGFMGSWDPHYKALVETHDPGQKPQEGGLLVAHTGKGAWIYLGLALYRQLPEGVPGSYRLVANLISAGKNPQFLAAK